MRAQRLEERIRHGVDDGDRRHRPSRLVRAAAPTLARQKLGRVLINRVGLTSASENEALLREAVMKKPEWHDVLEPREAVIAGIVGLAVVTRLTTPAVAGSDG